jgi:methionine sulfoxide reductase heme-binding subunit
MSRSRFISIIKIVVFVAALGPLAWLVLKAARNDLGANPVEFVTHATGDTALIFLLGSLAITPLRKIMKVPDLIRFRRMLGLYAFFYASLHLLTFAGLDHHFNWAEVLPDVYKRPFVTAGFTAWLLMLPLALTSTTWSIRKLGGKRWQVLHRLVYLSAIAGVVHYWWLVKKDITDPLIYAVILAVLLGFRLFLGFAGKGPRPAVVVRPLASK